jgi:hypothetical protein
LLLGFGLVFLFATPVASNRAISLAVTESAAANEIAASNGNSNGRPDAPVSHTRADSAMFHGMTLEQAIRSVEQRG